MRNSPQKRPDMWIFQGYVTFLERYEREFRMFLKKFFIPMLARVASRKVLSLVEAHSRVSRATSRVHVIGRSNVYTTRRVTTSSEQAESCTGFWPARLAVYTTVVAKSAGPRYREMVLRKLFYYSPCVIHSIILATMIVIVLF